MNDLKQIYPKVFGWMFLGLLLTFGTGYMLSTNETLMYQIFSSGMYWIFAIIELVVVIVFSVRVAKMSKPAAIACFLGYSILTGVTFSTIFLAYELGSIFLCFGAASILFLIMALFGHFTKLNLSKFGSLLFMLLIGSIIVSVINIFMGSSTVDLIISVVVLAVFICYVAYDMKKIGTMVDYAGVDNGSIYMALQLYLDFINIFLRLLQLFGKRDD